MSRQFIIWFIGLSFITQTIGSSGIGGRVVLSDLFGFLSIVVFLTEQSRKFVKEDIFARMFFLGFLLIIGGAFGINPLRTLFEVIILLFLVVIYFIIVQNFSTEKRWQALIRLVAITFIACVIVGFYDLYGKIIGLPRIFPARTAGEMKSGFRNAGQAGAYGLMFLVILLPIQLSRAIKLFKPKDRRLILWSIWLGGIFLFLTGKIAAYIGFAAGYVFYLILKRSFTSLFVIVAVAGLLVLLFPLLERVSPELYQRIDYKINARIVKNYEKYNDEEGLGEDNFFSNNWGSALKSFEDSPLTGSGLGAFAEGFGRYEVHSTYFKVIGEMGFLGTVGYVLVMSAVFHLFSVRRRKWQNEYGDYLVNAYPFFLGCVISWIYTYHLRKREFWIMLAVYVIAHNLSYQKNRNTPTTNTITNGNAVPQVALSV